MFMISDLEEKFYKSARNGDNTRRVECRKVEDLSLRSMTSYEWKSVAFVSFSVSAGTFLESFSRARNLMDYRFLQLNLFLDG